MPPDEEALNKAYAMLGRHSLKPKTFDDLTMREYIAMLLSSERWPTYAKVITMDKTGIDKMLTEVAEIRNKIAHFRGEVSGKERRALEKCRDWMSANLRDLSESLATDPKPTEELTPNPIENRFIGALEPRVVLDKSEQASPTLLYCRAKDLEAIGSLVGEKLVVKANSEAAYEAAPSLIKHVRSIANLRTKLIRERTIIKIGEKLVFAKDYEFSSPSTAAAVVLGRSANGLIEWKTKSGQTLKGLRENSDQTFGSQ